jgi:hypothetical protein
VKANVVARRPVSGELPADRLQAVRGGYLAGGAIRGRGLIRRHQLDGSLCFFLIESPAVGTSQTLALQPEEAGEIHVIILASVLDAPLTGDHRWRLLDGPM